MASFVQNAELEAVDVQLRAVAGISTDEGVTEKWILQNIYGSALFYCKSPRCSIIFHLFN